MRGRLLSVLESDEQRSNLARKALLRAKYFSEENVGKFLFNIIGD